MTELILVWKTFVNNVRCWLINRLLGNRAAIIGLQIHGCIDTEDLVQAPGRKGFELMNLVFDSDPAVPGTVISSYKGEQNNGK